MMSRTVVALVAMFSIAVQAQAAEITVLAGMGVISGIRDLAPAFEQRTGGSGIISAGVMEKLGIASQLKAKTKFIDGVPVAEAVARGEVEIGLQQNQRHSAGGGRRLRRTAAEGIAGDRQVLSWRAERVEAAGRGPGVREVHCLAGSCGSDPQERDGALALAGTNPSRSTSTSDNGSFVPRVY